MKNIGIGKALAAAATLSLAVAFAPSPAMAQDAAAKPEELTWARVTMTRFVSGKRERALEIIKNYFAKADQNSGVDSGVHGIHLDTGQWDVIYIFPMKGGPGDMAKQGTPEDAKWMAEMVKLAGSQEAAEKIIAEFDSLVAMSVTEVGHAHKDY
ncbi:hypothetical protein ACLBKU_08010 [Erythrobacter sp. NE805]|uniref:hypothetical protein n=1 Tax=Erythrobacter sp. NE805 TaxID=3389875 RepID=UPI00396B3E64